MTGTILDYMGASPFEGGEDLPPFRKGEKAMNPDGIGFYGPWDEPYSGFPEHSRRNALALDMAGIPVHLRSMSAKIYTALTAEEKRIHAQVKKLVDASIGTYVTQLYMFVPFEEQLQLNASNAFLEPAQLLAINAMKIFYNVWERQNISDAAVRVFNTIGQTWVACQDNKSTYIRCGVQEDKIHVVPMPFFEDDPLLKLVGRARKPGPPRFYHISKWEPRKEVRNIIGAFLMAFAPGKAKLFLKVNDLKAKIQGYPQGVEACMHEWILHDRVKSNGWTIPLINRDILIIKRMLPAEQIVKFHEVGDCYVTLSRGEGFDMPAFDAKLAGNMMIYTPSGGPQDFAESDRDILVPKTGTIPAHEFYRWGKEATYIDYDFETAVSAYQAAFDKITSNQSGVKNLDYLHDGFSAKNVGANMRSHIEELLSKNGVKAFGK
jgi:hypothetical protein